MSREVKRVPLDFDYPINKMIWKGYHNPYCGLKCEVCDGSGLSSEAKPIYDSWYPTDYKRDDGWYNKLTEDDIQALLDRDRLWDFTRVPRNEKQLADLKAKIDAGGNSWLPYNNGYTPTPDEVNAWAMKGFGHDVLNKSICCKSRCERLGISRDCPVCDGYGELWPDDKYYELAIEFEMIDPPHGEGYQLWETTSEGKPISPVFETPNQLAKWLTSTGTSSFGSMTATYEQWLAFIIGPGSACSMIRDSGGIRSGVEDVSYKRVKG